MEFNNHIAENNEVVVYADSLLFSKDAIFKCLYWYGGDFQTNVSLVGSGIYKITLRTLVQTKYNTEDLDKILLKLERDLIDFNLRDIVSKETKSIRELLIAKAFSNGEFDENPIGEVTDPVGFKIEDVGNEK